MQKSWWDEMEHNFSEPVPPDLQPGGGVEPRQGYRGSCVHGRDGDLLPIGKLLSLLLCTSSVINCSLRQLTPLHLLPLLLMTAARKWWAASYLIQRTTQHAGRGNKTWRHFIKTSRNTFSPELIDGLDSVKVSTPSPTGLSPKKSLNSPPAPLELKASLIWIKDGE